MSKHIPNPRKPMDCLNFGLFCMPHLTNIWSSTILATQICNLLYFIRNISESCHKLTSSDKFVQLKYKFVQSIGRLKLTDNGGQFDPL